jgi:hypothetical protein
MRGAESGPEKAMQLRVTVDDSFPEIWRLIEIDAATTLARLHGCIQILFGWDHSHLHEFTIPARVVDGRKQKSRLVDDEDELTLGDVLPRVRSKLHYCYDFGDDWRVTIAFVQRASVAETLPRCVDGERKGPPEDFGGIYWYNTMVEELALPPAERPPEIVEAIYERLGEDYDPVSIDLAELSKSLAGASRFSSDHEESPDSILSQIHEAEDTDWLIDEDCELDITYNPEIEPDPDALRNVDESELHLAVRQYHLRADEPMGEGEGMHEAMHCIVESQIADNDPPETRIAVARLVADGLSRHDAIHAAAWVVSDHMYQALTTKRPPDLVKIRNDMAALTRRKWVEATSEVPIQTTGRTARNRRKRLRRKKR